MTSKQRAYLRAMANDMQPVLYIGKEGVTDAVADELEAVLESRELVKAALQRGAPVTARQACDELCARTAAQPVQCIGSKFVVYRPSRERPASIVLP